MKQTNLCNCLFILPPQIISYDSVRGGVSVVIEKGTSTTSHLLIQRATAADSGEYRCEPANSLSASINLHIHRGTSGFLMSCGHNV